MLIEDRTEKLSRDVSDVQHGVSSLHTILVDILSQLKTEQLVSRSTSDIPEHVEETLFHSEADHLQQDKLLQVGQKSLRKEGKKKNIKRNKKEKIRKVDEKQKQSSSKKEPSLLLENSSHEVKSDCSDNQNDKFSKERTESPTFDMDGLFGDVVSPVCDSSEFAGRFLATALLHSPNSETEFSVSHSLRTPSPSFEIDFLQILESPSVDTKSISKSSSISSVTSDALASLFPPPSPDSESLILSFPDATSSSSLVVNEIPEPACASLVNSLNSSSVSVVSAVFAPSLKASDSHSHSSTSTVDHDPNFINNSRVGHESTTNSKSLVSVVSAFTNVTSSSTNPMSSTTSQKSCNFSNAKSSTAAPAPPILAINLLPQDEINRYRNAVLVQKLLPGALQTLLSWLCRERDENVKFLDFIKKKTNVSKTQLDKKYFFYPTEIKMLEGTDASSFDVTLLVKLIKLLANIGDCSHQDSKDHDDSSTECLLWKLKEFRNLVSHKIKTSSISEEIFIQGEEILLKFFKVLDCNKFSVDEKILDEERQNLKRLFEGVVDTDAERQSIEQQIVFKTEAFNESQSYWRVYCTSESVPFTEHVIKSEKVFHPMEIYVREENLTEGLSVKESYEHMLMRVNDDERRATVLIGEAGSGKTTVVKNIVLQFLEIIDAEIDFVRELHLLLFLECRDRTTYSLEKAMMNNFPKACRKISTDVKEAVECFRFLGNLIIIDGYDEVNDASSAVITEVLQLMKSMSFCQLLFTTRPHRASHLKELLKSNGVLYKTFELVPLSEEEDQLKFLERYEENISSTAPVFQGMAERFRSLLPEVKQFFIYPMNLVLFYFLYLHSRGTISRWETPNDVIEQMLLLYEKCIARKLVSRSLVNLDSFIREALEEIYQFAFRCITEDKIMLSAEEFKPIQIRLEDKFKEWQLQEKLDTSVITSVVFLTKTVPNPDCPTVYQFFHKGIQEIMAARTFVKLMKENIDVKLEHLLLPDPEIRKKSRNEFVRYENVFIFVLSFLCQPSNQETLHAREEELGEMLRLLGVNMKYCSEIALSKPHREPLVKLGASLMEPLTMWILERKRDFDAARLMLGHYQPSNLHIRHREVSPLPASFRELLLGIKNTYTGTVQIFVENSYDAFAPLDELVTEIFPASYDLDYFLGCLASEEGIRSLAVQMQRNESMFVSLSLPDPYNHHLQLLQGKMFRSKVRVLFTPYPSWPVSCRLPMANPALNIARTGDGKDLFLLIASLAPQQNTFQSITVEDCTCSDQHLQDTATALQEKGITTHAASSTSVETLGFKYTLCGGCRKLQHLPGKRCVRLHVKKN
ncbi:P-loop containing nucleoside triphosphate hydrolase [Trinorchestia longiramus]|nr:P-loop containing nucleoside triphosphate hydrolase [Trinorchestia longiramus]